MSKTIKYRAWDKKTKEYRDVRTIYFSVTGEVEGVETVDPITGHDPWYQDIDEVVLEQHTGLKDKKGEEICAGDIVSEHNGDILGEIIQKPSGEYCIAWIGIYGGSSILYNELSMCEIIGNIHEYDPTELKATQEGRHEERA